MLSLASNNTPDSFFLKSTPSGAEATEPASFSIASFKRQALNEHFSTYLPPCSTWSQL
jgi:hypothetical protein